MSTSACTTRLARPDDVSVIHALKREMVLAEGSAHTFRASKADWQRDMFGPQPRFCALVAEAGGEVVGMATLVERYYPAWVGSSFVLDDIFVKPEHRGAGIGKALLAHAAAEALRRGAVFIELMVRTQNPARHLYEQVGFEPVAGATTYVLAGDALVALAGAKRTIAGASA
jgi:ribosomal protein S18 acetylase RimI-like enzyme